MTVVKTLYVMICEQLTYLLDLQETTCKLCQGFSDLIFLHPLTHRSTHGTFYSQKIYINGYLGVRFGAQVPR